MDSQASNFLCCDHILADIWSDIPKKGGMFKETPRGRISSMVKPLSAITVSPFEKGRFKKPLRSTISLSVMLPVYRCPINVKNPFGEIPTNAFKVVLCVYELKSSLFKRRLLGISQRTPVQSMITLVVGYFALKSSGIVSLTSSLDGQMLIWPSFKYKKFIQEIKIRLTVGWEMLNNWPKCNSSKPCLSLQKVRKNSSTGFKVLGLPCFTDLGGLSTSFPDSQ